MIEDNHTQDVDESPAKFCQLHQTLTESDSLIVVCHDNPDPDCLASALALATIAAELGIGTVEIAYGGNITHQQNRAMVNVLDIKVSEINELQLGDFERVAFVDHSISGRNNSVPDGCTPDIVIDHHPATDIRAGYADNQPTVGATATLLVQYVREFEIELDERLATALLFGIHRETLHFTRGTTPREHAAACFLHPIANHADIERMTLSAFTPGTLDGIGDAIGNREVRGSTLVTTLGRIRDRDVLPQAADYLLKLEGVRTTVACGIIDDVIHLSARTNHPQVHIGNLLQDVFDEEGSAGGHGDMAGGQVPLGILASISTEKTVDIVDRSIRTRLFDAIEGELIHD